MNKNSGFVAETIYFWRRVLSNPIRLIAWVAFFGIIWVKDGWIFHPISSIITTAISALLIIGASVYVFKLTGTHINWNSRSTQKKATSLSVVLPIALVIYMVLRGHIIAFTVIVAIIVAIILAVAFKDSIFK